MVTVDPKRTVRIKADPIEQNQSTAKLANYLKSELKKRSQVEEL